MQVIDKLLSFSGKKVNVIYLDNDKFTISISGVLLCPQRNNGWFSVHSNGSHSRVTFRAGCVTKIRGRSIYLSSGLDILEFLSYLRCEIAGERVSKDACIKLIDNAQYALCAYATP